MILISDLVSSLSRCLVARRELEQCRQRAVGDAEYYSHGYVQASNQAEADFEQKLNAYIDQRVAQPGGQFQTLSGLEQLSPDAHSAALVA